MNKRLTAQGKERVSRKPRLVKNMFSICEISFVSLPLSLISHYHRMCTHTMSARVRGAGTGKGIRRENFANGRIIKGDSDHVSGTVHTVTSRAPSQWTPLVGIRLAGEQRCTRTWLPAFYTSLGPGNGFHDSPFPW